MNTIQIIPQTRYVGQFIPLIQWETPVLLLVLAMSEKAQRCTTTRWQRCRRTNASCTKSKLLPFRSGYLGAIAFCFLKAKGYSRRTPGSCLGFVHEVDKVCLELWLKVPAQLPMAGMLNDARLFTDRVVFNPRLTRNFLFACQLRELKETPQDVYRLT